MICPTVPTEILELVNGLKENGSWNKIEMLALPLPEGGFKDWKPEIDALDEYERGISSKFSENSL